MTREQVSVKVDVFLEDLFLFHNLKPNEADYLDAAAIRRGIELHKNFVSERFVIQDVEGHTLQPSAAPTVTAELPAEGVPLAELMAHRLTFQMQYTLQSPPEFLTFRQCFTDEVAVLPSEMQLQVKQENAGDPFRETLVTDVPYSVRFSWTNPSLSPGASEEAWNRWAAQQQEETLGITSYSSVYSFLYIDDREIRHEILIPLLTLEQSVMIERDDDNFLDVAEQDAARPRIEAYFTSGNPVAVDGQLVEPVVQRCDFYGLNFKDFARQVDRKQVSMTSARVGIILSYPLESAPTSLQLTWDRFNQSLWAVNMVVFDGDETTRKMLTRIARNNVFQWESPGRAEIPPLEPVPALPPDVPTCELPIFCICFLMALPAVLVKMKRSAASTLAVWIVSGLWLLTAGMIWQSPTGRVRVPLGRAAVMENEEADAIFARVHANLYDAFHYHGESDVYDALAVSIDGDLLPRVYLQIQRGLKMQEQGGAVSRIRRVEIIDGQRQAMPARLLSARFARGFAYRCRWNVAGTVEHWGHIHQRTNQYEAVFTVVPLDNAWKVSEIKLLDERRIQFETRLRKR